jgi:hypothetical protein
MEHVVRHQDLRAKAVILACGGFEANAEMRARGGAADTGWRRRAACFRCA